MSSESQLPTWGEDIAFDLLTPNPYKNSDSLHVVWKSVQQQAQRDSATLAPGDPPEEPKKLPAWIYAGYLLVFDNCCNSLLSLSKSAGVEKYKQHLSGLESKTLKFIQERLKESHSSWLVRHFPRPEPSSSIDTTAQEKVRTAIRATIAADNRQKKLVATQFVFIKERIAKRVRYWEKAAEIKARRVVKDRRQVWKGSKRALADRVLNDWKNGKISAKSQLAALNKATDLYVMYDGSAINGRSLQQNLRNRKNEGKN